MVFVRIFRKFTSIALFLFLVLFMLTTSKSILGSTVSGEIFLQGNYVEIGIHSLGSLGTVNDAPSGFHPIGRTKLGAVADIGKDGWTTGSPAQTGDFIMPGGAEERWGVEWTMGAEESSKFERTFDNAGALYTEGHILGSNDIAKISLVESSDANFQRAIWIGQAAVGNDQKLKVTRTFHLGIDDLFFRISVELENTGTTTLNGVEYFHSLDPDNEKDTGGTYVTSNYVAYQPGSGGNADKALVVASGLTSPSVLIGLGTIDARARVTTEGITISDPDSILDSPTAPTKSTPREADEAIGLAFRLGLMQPGAKLSIEYAFIFSADDLDRLASVMNFQPTADSINISTVGNKPVNITLSGSDVEEEPLSFSLTSYPKYGRITGVLPNLIYQRENTSYYGDDTFQYKVNDGTDDSKFATVTITIEPDTELTSITITPDIDVIAHAPIKTGTRLQDSVTDSGKTLLWVWEIGHSVVNIAHPDKSTTISSPQNCPSFSMSPRARLYTIQVELAELNVVEPNKDNPSILCAWRLKAYDVNGNLLEGSGLDSPATLRVKLTDAQIDQFGGIPEFFNAFSSGDLRINKLWDDGTWKPIHSSTINLPEQTIEAAFNGFATYALLYKGPMESNQLQEIKTPDTGDTSIALWVLLVSVLGAACLVTGISYHRRMRPKF